MDSQIETSLYSQTSSISDLPEKSINNPSLPSGHSFISYSDIENPQIEISLKPEEESSSHQASSSLDITISDSFSSIIPKSEPSLKHNYSEPDLDSENSLKLSGFECEFFIRYKTLFGQSLILVGSSIELGEWDLCKGVKMTWKPGHLWTSKVSIKTLPAEYKYVCCFYEEFIWEKGQNRKVLKRVEEVFDYWQEF